MSPISPMVPLRVDSADLPLSDEIVPSFDLDVTSYESHDRVSHYVQLFSGSARERFNARLSRGTRYEPMIRAKLREAGMPEDLLYLALIESGFDPHAYSRAAAVGMWQFMTTTARGVGLRVDWWVDERRDPARATDGAIRFLGSLQRQFGSIYLAAAAYNGGPGRVSRGLTQFAEEMEGAEGEDRFFALAEQNYLRTETRDYVPQLIAATLIAREPSRFGLSYDTLTPYAYDSVEVLPGTSLSALREASGATESEIRDLNPSFLRGIAPPDRNVWMKVPAGYGERTALALASFTDSARLGYSIVRTTGKETAVTVAKKAGITSTQLAWYNPDLRKAKSGKLVSGQRVRVPLRSTLAYAVDVPNPSIEKYGPASVVAKTHTVKRGETLSGIASRYGISVTKLKSLNGMKGDKIVAGRKLKVSGSVPAKKTAARRAAVR